MKFSEYLNEGQLVAKLKKWVADLDRKFDSDTRTDKEIVQQIKNLDDDVLALWYKEGQKHKFGFAIKMFPDDVEREMKRRKLLNESATKDLKDVLKYAGKEDLSGLNKNDTFSLTFDYEDGFYNYDFNDSSEEGIKKEFAKLIKAGKFSDAYGYDSDEEESEISNVKFKDISNLTYEIK